MTKQLYHFSEDAGITVFEPRPVRVPAPRGPGLDWLNGPLVWAIEGAFSALYLFPRDCPRIVMWRKETSRAEDVARYWTDPNKRMVAFVEERWFGRLRQCTVTRYTLPCASFIDLSDAGMHVSQSTVIPTKAAQLTELPNHLNAANVELRCVPSLHKLKSA